MTVERFEDLIAWQKARELTRNIYRVSAHGAFAADFGLKDQVRRTSVSIMSNLAEGFDRTSRAEFHRFIAKRSCAEVRLQLYTAMDVGYMGQDLFDGLNRQATEVAKVLAGLRKSVEQQKGKQ